MRAEAKRDHGGNLDAAIAEHGGARSDWTDLSTGINPVPYPVGDIPANAWTALPDRTALSALEEAARAFWRVPPRAGVLAVPGASAAIARIPLLAQPGRVCIPGPTYNEHAASFRAAGWQVTETGAATDASVHVHPNNPDGRFWRASDLSGHLRIIDESFCDVAPDRSLIAEAETPGTLVLKSFGKFWGLAGVRLGFVIGDPVLLEALAGMLGPWSVSGPAIDIGRAALVDTGWAEATRDRLAQDAGRLDRIITREGAEMVGGTPLFRLYRVANAKDWQDRLAAEHIWSRIFPYDDTWLRLGLPDGDGFDRIESVFA